MPSIFYLLSLLVWKVQWSCAQSAESIFSPNNEVLQVELGKNALFDWRYFLKSGEFMQTLTFGLFEGPDHRTLSKNPFALKKRDGQVEYNPQMPLLYQNRIFVTADDLSLARMEVRNVNLQDDSKYFGVWMETKDNRAFHVRTKLEVTEKPVITSRTTSPQETIEGSRLMLECSARGRPPPVITWKRTFPGNSQAVTIASGMSSKSLEFRSVNGSHDGEFQCIAENSAGMDEYMVTVVVNYKPVIDNDKSTRRAGTYVDNPLAIRLRCVASGRPTPSYEWVNPAGKMVTSRPVYSLSSPALFDFGVYTCTVKNAVGTTKHLVEVYRIYNPDPVELWVEDITSDSATIIWKLPQETGESPLQRAILEYEEDGQVKTIIYPTNQTRARLEKLHPYYVYFFNVSVQNEFLKSKPTSQRVHTEQAIPGPPDNVIVTPMTPNRLRVQWEPPISKNGVITQYVVAFAKAETYNVNLARKLSMSLAQTSDLLMLEPFTEYKVQVQAYTMVGAGPWSLAVTATTPVEAPSAPIPIERRVLGPYSVEIRWEKPERISGPITRYRVRMIYEKEGSTVTDVREYLHQTPLDVRVMVVDRLKAYTNYLVSVAEGAGSDPVWGPYANFTAFSTPEGVPSAPVNLHILSKTPSSLFLRWQRPEDINGNLTHYALSFENETAKYEIEIKKDIHNQTFYYKLQNLQRNTEYLVRVRAFTRVGAGSYSNHLKIFTSLGNAVVSGAFKDNELSAGPIIGGIFSFLVILVLLIILILYIARKQRIQKKALLKGEEHVLKLHSGEDPLSPEPMTKLSEAPVSQNGNTTVFPLANGGGKSKVRTFTIMCQIPVEELRDYCERYHANKDQEFIKEFKSIKPEGDYTYEICQRAENKCKNRYANIVAYDHSRVVLSTIDNMPGSDYINANYIDGYNKKDKFIATQGPLNASFDEFWRMIWEQNTSVIVMITNLMEKSRVKCQKYWPSGEAHQYGKILVTPDEELEVADHVIRRFLISMTSSKAKQDSRVVTQFQFTSWPDHGVPQYPTSLLHFIKRVRTYMTEESGPIVVHCSAGVGRTGTYITLDAMLDQIRLEGAVDVLGFVTHIRRQRNYMVQTEPQYIFVYDALLEEVTCGETEISPPELLARIKRLDQTNPDTVVTLMQEEFERLNVNLATNHQYEAALLPANSNKNRFPSVLPFESTRVKLWPYPGVEGSDYINACFVDGYQQREAYITTQAPLENTVEDLWRMIWEYEIFSVVMLSSSEERDMHHCYPYWPVNSKPANFGLLIVQIAAEEERSGFVKREFRVTNSKTGETRVITHFMYYDWPEEACPSDCSLIIDMIAQLQKTQQMTGNGSICIHCSDGSGRTGTLCTIMYCIERVKTEGVFDVFQTVRAMRTQRAGVVRTVDQYRFIYISLRKFIDTFFNYANFK